MRFQFLIGTLKTERCGTAKTTRSVVSIPDRYAKNLTASNSKAELNGFNS